MSQISNNEQQSVKTLPDSTCHENVQDASAQEFTQMKDTSTKCQKNSLKLQAMITSITKYCVQKVPTILHWTDEVAEWLRRWTANPLGYTRVGSNPILVELWYTLF